MSSHQHMLCTKNVSLRIREMAALDFPAFGSIYFSDAAIEPSKKIPLNQEGLCMGPNCSPVVWNCSPGELDLYGGPSPDCGTWTDLASYASGLIKTGHSRIPQAHMIKQPLPYQGSIQEHIDLLHISQRVLEHLTKDSRIQNAASPTLIHPDLHKRNIYVNPNDPTIITGIIDWQSTGIEPAFLYTNETPDFASLPDESLLDEVDESKEKQKLTDAKICHQTYDVIMKGLIPKIRPVKLLNPTLFQPFHYCHTTWRDSVTALRHELMELSARWSELGMEESCPYSPGEEEVSKHAQYYEDFETVQRLKLWLKNSLNTDSDGWVPNEIWDAAKNAHKTAYDEWMETAREAKAQGDGLTVEKADRLWPFDSR